MKKFIVFLVLVFFCGSAWSAQLTIDDDSTYTSPTTMMAAVDDNFDELYAKWVALGAAYDTAAELDALFALYYGSTAIDTWRNSVTQTEMGYLHGVTSDVQTQIDGKQDSMGSDDNYVTDAEKTVIGNTSGTNTGDDPPNDTAYDATSWNGNTDAPTKNAVRDKIETLGSGSANVEDDVYGSGWDGDTTNAPSQNAVYDKIEGLAGGHDAATIGTANGLSLSGQEISLSAATNSAAGAATAAQITALEAIDTEAELEALLELADLQGDLSDSQLSSNVPLLDEANTFTEDITTPGIVVSKVSGTAGSIGMNEAYSTDTSKVGYMGPASISESFYHQFPNAQPDDQFYAWAAPTGTDGPDSSKVSAATLWSILDEDAMGSDSATAVPTQQSVKKYVDDNAGGTVASSSEVNTGTDNAKFISPDALAGSIAFTKDVGWTIVDSDTDTPAAANGVQAYTVPPSLNGMNLVDVVASVHTKGVTGTIDIQVRKRSGGTDSDMLSTKITLGDEFYASDETIDTSEDDISTGDQIYIDVDAIHSGTAAKGLSVTLLFRLP